MKIFIYLSIYLAALCMLSCESDSVNPQDEQMLIENELATSRGVEAYCPPSLYECDIIPCDDFYSSNGAWCKAGVWEIFEEFYWQYENMFSTPDLGSCNRRMEINIDSCVGCPPIILKGCTFHETYFSLNDTIKTSHVCQIVNERVNALMACVYSDPIFNPCSVTSTANCSEFYIYPKISLEVDPNYCECGPTAGGSDRLLIIESVEVYCCN